MAKWNEENIGELIHLSNKLPEGIKRRLSTKKLDLISEKLSFNENEERLYLHRLSFAGMLTEDEIDRLDFLDEKTK